MKKWRIKVSIVLSKSERALQSTPIQIHDVQLAYGRLEILLFSNNKNDSMSSSGGHHGSGVLSPSDWCYSIGLELEVSIR